MVTFLSLEFIEYVSNVQGSVWVLSSITNCEIICNELLDFVLIIALMPVQRFFIFAVFFENNSHNTESYSFYFEQRLCF